MGVFGHFKKSKPELSDEEIRLNQMWALWAEGYADSPWRELMTYQGEVNKGGHDQYFLNTGNTGDLQKKMAILETVLPESCKAICEKHMPHIGLYPKKSPTRKLRRYWNNATRRLTKTRGKSTAY